MTRIYEFPRAKRPTPDELQGTYRRRYRFAALRDLAIALLVGAVPLFLAWIVVGLPDPAELPDDSLARAGLIYLIVAGGLFLGLYDPALQQDERHRVRAVLDAADRNRDPGRE